MPAPMRLRMPITARSMCAPCMMQPSEMSAFLIVQFATFDAGRKRGLV